jgi:Protein of unknown function (DUF2490)
MHYKLFVIVFAMQLCVSPSVAQTTRISDHNTIGWFNNFTTIPVSKKWSGHLEYQWRRDDLIKNWQQGLFRTGINYQASNKIMLRFGYAWVQTFPYGDVPLQSAGKKFPEHRLFQMVTMSDKINKLDISHRFMLEQRWIGRYTNASFTKPDVFIFQNRLRYMYRMQLPLARSAKTTDLPYTAIYDEIFLGFGKNVQQNVFDQNRLAILLGVRFNKILRIEGGYFQQILQLGRAVDNRNVFQYNNGLILNSYLNLHWSKTADK